MFCVAHIHLSTMIEELKHLISKCLKHLLKSQRAAMIYHTTGQQTYYSET